MSRAAFLSELKKKAVKGKSKDRGLRENCHFDIGPTPTLVPLNPRPTDISINEDKDERRKPVLDDMNLNGKDPSVGNYILVPSGEDNCFVLEPNNLDQSDILTEVNNCIETESVTNQPLGLDFSNEDGFLLLAFNENLNENHFDVDLILSNDNTTPAPVDDNVLMINVEKNKEVTHTDNEPKVQIQSNNDEHRTLHPWEETSSSEDGHLTRDSGINASGSEINKILRTSDDDPTYVPSEEENYSSDIEHNTAEGENNAKSNNDSKEVPCQRKRAKKRKSDKSLWTANLNKEKRCKGEEYYGRRRNGEGKVVFDVKKPKRTLKARCTCCEKNSRSFACVKISEAMRQNIFKTFYSLSNGEKKVFVKGLVIKKPVVQRKVDDPSTSRRNYSLLYFLKPEETNERLKVCKKMFLSTLDVGEWAVCNWVSSSMLDSNEVAGGTEEDVDDVDCVEKNTSTNENRSLKPKYSVGRQILNEFFEELPKLESHYCRKSSKKLYLEPRWQSKAQLYREYIDFCKSKNKESNVVSMFTFQTVFDDLNLAIFSPKKDQCDYCCAYQVGNISEGQYREHMKRKEKARMEKDYDKTNTDETTLVFTMDLQAVLLSPSLKASALYYRTKLKVHNFTLYNLKTSDGYCYLWDETEGGLNADEFASILYHFLTNEIDKEKCKNVIVYSDGCTYQNRNSIVSNTLLLASKELGIVITQKFLEKGHTQMECDSMHSCIERKLKNREIYSPVAYTEACRTARIHPSPYKVQYLKHSFFLKYSDLNFISSIRPGKKKGDPVVTNLRCIKYSADGSVQVKLDFEDAFSDLPRRIQSPTSDTTVKPLYRNKIPLQAIKFKHLQEMKSVIPREVHQFYDSLPHLSKSANKLCQGKPCSCVIQINVDF